MKTLGIVLLVCGLIMLVYGGITYNHDRTVLDVGPLQAKVTEQKKVPFSPVVAGIALVGGLLLLVIPRKRVA